MYSKINFVHASWLLLLQHVGLMLVVKELNNRHPRITVVDIISKAGCVDNSKAHYKEDINQSSFEIVSIHLTFEELLLKLGLCDLDLNSLVDLLRVTAFVIRVVLNSSRKESIDECRLSQA